jgi:uncharacterized protein (DUF4415 family)
MMKKQRVVTRRRKHNSTFRLRASAEEGEAPPAAVTRWEKYRRENKKPITLSLDADIVAWFKREGPGYQTRMNRALRKLMLEERKMV